MNHRIKKKLKKKASKSMIQFGPYPHNLIPAKKTYREIKLKRKYFHKVLINCRHVTHKLIGYSYQLRTCRRSRKDV